MHRNNMTHTPYLIVIFELRGFESEVIEVWHCRQRERCIALYTDIRSSVACYLCDDAAHLVTKYAGQATNAKP